LGRVHGGLLPSRSRRRPLGLVAGGPILPVIGGNEPVFRHPPQHPLGADAAGLEAADLMFDIGALELVLIGVVALLVVGPERLPKLARTAGLWIGRARRALASVKDEIDREVKADELREILRRQAESNPLDRLLEGESDAPSGRRPAGSGRRSESPSSGVEDGAGRQREATGRAGAGDRQADDDASR
jgi:sec-independent protein translocase protein TatB